ncbi:unnamed protein product [Caenorhabditis angaria]|uniref:Uncharacterized protein n=1 Tax=Caenorhabditis angaria TaxID=860376 RepID=A0A9P1N7Q8_9PELO|nr:unnamed protein product [Caenorhabditis angaria]
MFIVLLIFCLIQEISSLSIENVYTRYINREKIDQADTFGFQIPRPIAYKGDEPIYPRSYGYSAEMFFDENGAGFPLRKRPHLSQIFGSLAKPRYQEDRDDEERERDYIREFMRRVSKRRNRNRL